MTGNGRLRFLDMQLCIYHPQNELEALQWIELSGDNAIVSRARGETRPTLIEKRAESPWRPVWFGLALALLGR